MKSQNQNRELNEARQRVRQVEGELAFTVDLFGDHLAKREGYHEHSGIDAVHFYLCQKHHWLPAQVRALNWDDLRFLLAEEMAGWTREGVSRELRGFFFNALAGKTKPVANGKR
jgi:hypothetical protein